MVAATLRKMAVVRDGGTTGIPHVPFSGALASLLPLPLCLGYDKTGARMEKMP